MARLLRLAAAASALACIGAALSVPAANAQIPGESPRSFVVTADSPMVTINVDPPNLTEGKITGTLKNNTAKTLTCKGLPNPDTSDTSVTRTPALSATRAEIVSAGQRYYAQFPFEYAPAVKIDASGINPPLGIGGDFMKLYTVSLGSVTTALPSFLVGLAWPSYGAQADIAAAVTDARIKGQFGTVQDVTLAPNENKSLQVPLNDPAQRFSDTSPREDFTAAMYLACQIDGRYYTFAGYQGGYATSPSGGSVGQLFDTGMLGS